MIAYLLGLVPPLYERGLQFTGFVKAIGEEFEEFVQATLGTSQGWVTANAGTYALNQIGELVGLPRPDWADNDQYRRLLFAMYIALNSKGTYGEVQRVLDYVLNQSDSEILPAYPAGFEVNFLQAGLTQAQAELASRILEIVTPAGVGYSAYWSATPYFSWQEDTNPLAGGWGDPWIQEI